jgi:hypothetical protein
MIIVPLMRILLCVETLILYLTLSLSHTNSDAEPKKKEKVDTDEKTAVVEEKRKRVNLIDAKRGQNAGIALARIKVGFPEVRERCDP